MPPIGDSFTCTEAIGNNYGPNVFVSFERTDPMQISKITFNYNQFTTGKSKSLDRFRSQLPRRDKTCCTRYNIPKNDRYSNSSTQWTLVDLNFTLKHNGI